MVVPNTFRYPRKAIRRRAKAERIFQIHSLGEYGHSYLLSVGFKWTATLRHVQLAWLWASSMCAGSRAHRFHCRIFIRVVGRLFVCMESLICLWVSQRKARNSFWEGLSLPHNSWTVPRRRYSMIWPAGDGEFCPSPVPPFQAHPVPMINMPTQPQPHSSIWHTRTNGVISFQTCISLGLHPWNIPINQASACLLWLFWEVVTRPVHHGVKLIQAISLIHREWDPLAVQQPCFKWYSISLQ